MEAQALELEGTWEEILTHADELAGRKVRLIVLPVDGLSRPALDTVQSPTLEELISGITEENRHAEFSTGSALGNEVW